MARALFLCVLIFSLVSAAPRKSTAELSQALTEVTAALSESHALGELSEVVSALQTDLQGRHVQLLADESSDASPYVTETARLTAQLQEVHENITTAQTRASSIPGEVTEQEHNRDAATGEVQRTHDLRATLTAEGERQVKELNAQSATAERDMHVLGALEVWVSHRLEELIAPHEDAEAAMSVEQLAAVVAQITHSQVEAGEGEGEGEGGVTQLLKTLSPGDSPGKTPQEVRDLVVQLEKQAQLRYSEVQQALANLTVTLGNQQQMLDTKVADAERTLQTAQTRIDSLNQELNSLNDEIPRLQAEGELLERRLEEQREKEGAVHASYAVERAELEQLLVACDTILQILRNS